MISQWIFYGFSTMASNFDSLNMSLLNNIETRLVLTAMILTEG